MSFGICQCKNQEEFEGRSVSFAMTLEAFLLDVLPGVPYSAHRKVLNMRFFEGILLLWKQCSKR